MKSYELESFLKSFILFFGVQILFLSIVIFQDYKKVAHEYDMHIGNTMMQCHLNNNCKDFNNQIVENLAHKDLHTLYNEDEIYMLFQSNNEFVKILMPKVEYLEQRYEIKRNVLFKYGVYFVLLLLVSILFALYTIRPLKEALKINEEFVKDILHDFNTPLAALNINYKILKKQFGENDALARSEAAIKNILSLQTNLHFFLNQSKLQNDEIALKYMVNERVTYFKTIFEGLSFDCKMDDVKLYTNENAFMRIIDNLLSNAGKYNKSDGFIKIYFYNNILTIEDSGKGIKNPKKIFNRYYKENETGIGIGLHIVKKLCDELQIPIELTTTLHKGSKFSLDLSKLIMSRSSK